MQRINYINLFNENLVMTIEHLKEATGRPRESILRDLKDIGYYSSYNERGKYYTLSNTPEFDGFGLWKYHHAYFSAKRTLLYTAEHLINVSDAGYTHDELRRIIGIEAHNSLYRLTISGRLVRQQVGAEYVYFGINNIVTQVEKRGALPIHVRERTRNAIKATDAKSPPGIGHALVIDILVAALRGYETVQDAHSHLLKAGSPATVQQVFEVFRYYGVGKKNS